MERRKKERGQNKMTTKSNRLEESLTIFTFARDKGYILTSDQQMVLFDKVRGVSTFIRLEKADRDIVDKVYQAFLDSNCE
jgi:uncharacterized membrane protein YfhO